MLTALSKRLEIKPNLDPNLTLYFLSKSKFYSKLRNCEDVLKLKADVSIFTMCNEPRIFFR